MTTVIFVHGTGVRGIEYSESFKRVAKELLLLQKDITVTPCLWGDTLGTKLNAAGLSIPLYDATLGMETVQEKDYDLMLWAMLYQDPLYEMRLLSLGAQSVTDFIPGQVPQGQALEERVRNFKGSQALQQKLDEAGISLIFNSARQEVLNSAPFSDALRAVPQSQASYRMAIARAIVAQAIAQSLEGQQYPAILMDTALRNEVVESIGGELGEADLGIGNWVAHQLFGLAQRLGAMNQVKRRRGAITDAAFPFTGDILLYQARGSAIRNFIRNCVEQSGESVVILSHSLGGIASVDLLVEESLPQIKLLITVGSQAPFLYELDALQSLAYGQPLPGHFPPWLNIYDLNDFLSYVGGSIFPEKVQDVLVDNKQPFPQAHSAYWGNPATWKAIKRRLP